jgi:ring-1,2-phenylacetyl-CoA epoxidase subunit PaaC
MASALDSKTNAALFDLALGLGDDALILGHRLSEWSSRAPTLEEDIALSNLALDLMGQARFFLSLASEIEGKGRDEDRLAYFRDEQDFRNIQLVEQPNGDFAQTIARHLYVSAFLHPYYEAMTRSADARLQGLAGKAVKEMSYHLRHAREWTIRLGDGTTESQRRMREGLEALWVYTGELFEMSEGERFLVSKGIAPDRQAIKPLWDKTIDETLKLATLTRPVPRGMQTGGRRGVHTENLSRLLAEMQVLARAHEGAVW